MYKKHLLLNMEREIVLLKRLANIITDKDLEFRPTPKVRSTYELMQYLSGIGSTMMHWFMNGMTPEFREERKIYNSTLTIENFPARLDEQWEKILGFMEGISEEELAMKEVELPWKEKMPLGAAIMNAPVKWLAAYRMELFMYLKMNGHEDLATKDAWVPAETIVNS